VSGHVSTETLATFREELLPRRKARRVAAHLARCAQCAGLDAQLAGLPALLAGAPAPAMPDALTARITAALAAEAAARSASSPAGAAGAELAGAAAPAGAGDAGGSGRGRHSRPPVRDRSRLTLRIAAATAAVAIVGGGGYGVFRLVSSTGPAAPATASSGVRSNAAAAPSVHLPPKRSGTARSGGEHSAISSAPTEHVVASGTNYQPGQLTTQVNNVLAHANSPEAPPATTQPTPAFGSTVTGCVAHVTGGQRPLLVDHARYEGKPATVIVLPGTRADTLRVLVAGPDCSATATDLLASTTVPGRP
jgi:hypothetical protein